MKGECFKVLPFFWCKIQSLCYYPTTTAQFDDTASGNRMKGKLKRRYFRREPLELIHAPG